MTEPDPTAPADLPDAEPASEPSPAPEDPRPAEGPRPWTWRASAALAIVVGLALAVLSPGSPAVAGHTARIDPRLASAVAAEHGGPVQALLVLDDTPVTRQGRARVADLKQVAHRSQVAVLRQVHDRTDATVLNSFWLQNMVLVEFSGGQQALDALASVQGVDRVIANFAMTLVAENATQQATTGATVEDRTWGLDRIEATRVQDELGIDGTGVRVATLDTGVDIAHPDLAGKMATTDPADPAYPGGWLEFDGNGNPVQSVPHDSAEHGTHVSGTIHGGAASGVRIGVAPGATMMHGLVIPGGEGSFSQVAAGMQWALSPYDNQGNPAGEPADVINMSLGPQFGGYADELVVPSRNALLAGTVVVAASGNCGDGCHGSPGNVYDNIAVGNTTVTDDVNDTSSGGIAEKSGFTDPPADWPDTWVTPDVSAPGTNILSTLPGGTYGELTGTSMASPHVAGTVALITQAAPELSPAQVLEALRDSAFFDDRYGTQRPNTRYGYGRIDAYDAVAPLAYDGGVTGTVTAAGAPLAGVTVTDRTTGSHTTTGADGAYQLRAGAGTHEIAAEKFGYTTEVASVEVAEAGFTRHDVTLREAPAGAVDGTVTFAGSGHGVPGMTVELTGTPLHTTTGDGGTFHLADVPAGSYDVTASLPGYPNPPPVHVTVEGGATATAALVMPVPPPTVGVLGSIPDAYAGTIGAFLDAHGIANEAIGWDADMTRFDAIVVNRPGDPGDQRFRDFLAATDAAGIGVVFLDTWQNNGNGISLLTNHLHNPASRSTGTDTLIPALSYRVTAAHPVLDGFAVGDDIVFNDSTLFKDYAWFDGYTGEGRMAIADVVRSDQQTPVGRGIGVQQRANNRHVLLSMHGASSYVDPTSWTADAGTVFLNAVRWTSRPPNPARARFVPSNLRVDTDSTLSGRPVTISVTLTNIGADAGDNTTTLTVDGAPEQTSTVHLAGGESTTVSWTVSRTDLRSYTFAVGSLTGTFRVRAPAVHLTVSTVDGPLTGATVELASPDGLTPVGTTGADGTAEFETTTAAGEYTVVVRKNASPLSYLLTRKVEIADDVDLTMGDDPVSVVTLAADGGGQSWTFLRNEQTAPWAFPYLPGQVVVTAGQYELRHLHAMTAPERDTWGVSAIVQRDFASAATVSYGGPATATVDATLSRSGELAGTWSVTDAHGNAFSVLARTDLRPFEALPAVSLEDLPQVIGGTAPNPTEVVLRVYDGRHNQVYGAGLTWSDGTFAAQLGKVRGTYTVEIRAVTGGYAPGEVIATGTVRG